MANAQTFNVNLQEISLEGYQIVSSKYFGRQTNATMSLQRKCIVFNSEVVRQLNNCEAITIMINEKNRSLLVKPISSHDSEAILWNKGGEKQYARLECITLTKYLMELWELSDKVKYILSGRLVRAENKVGMIFELDHCEMYNSETGKRIWE